MDTTSSSKPKLTRVKRTAWPEEIISCPDAIDMSDDGWFISCKVCKNFGHPIGKYRIKMRHAFGPARFFSHLHQVEFHKKALAANDKKSNQATINTFFSKKPRLDPPVENNDEEESLSLSSSSPSLSTLQELVIKCDGIYSSKENSLAKKVLSTCFEFVKIPSTSLYEFTTHKSNLCIKHKSCDGSWFNKLKRSNPTMFLCNKCYSL